ncbi:hypothetical protein phiOC_p360 [Ochrobactrum phage vB_OspM_OC]|nr:hypothetical protein phiOC_p360 [Ochrobactrum phage vB_OspM_OC]
MSKWVFPFIKFFFFAIFLFAMKLLSIVLSPFLSAWSVIAKINVLPAPFSWFHTNDDTLDGGQNQLGWPKVTGFKLFLQRMKWICRNPAYGFAAYVVGFKTEGHEVVYSRIKNPDGSQNFDWRAKGMSYFAIMKDAKGKHYFVYRRVWKDDGKKNTATWIGWNYVPYDGVYHHMKINPIKFSTRD